jgi:hypothetical protein
MGMIEAALLAQALTKGRLEKALHAGMLAERGELANARERARGLAAARSRWLSDHDAERSFPWGVVEPEGLIDATVRDRRAELAVIAAVLPSTVRSWSSHRRAIPATSRSTRVGSSEAPAPRSTLSGSTHGRCRARPPSRSTTSPRWSS